jgi:hypothetical protein
MAAVAEPRKRARESTPICRLVVMVMSRFSGSRW